MEKGMKNEEELVRRLREGESGALHEAITLHHGFLLVMARSLVGPTLAEDVVQETWLKALASVGKFEGRASFRTWLARIAINEAHALQRKQRRELPRPTGERNHDSGSPIGSLFDQAGAWRVSPPQWHHDTPEELLTEAELHACIRKHLQMLPGDQRTVVMLRELAGLDYEEIAQALGLGEGNIRVLLHRGRQRMHAMLARFQEEGTC